MLKPLALLGVGQSLPQILPVISAIKCMSWCRACAQALSTRHGTRLFWTPRRTQTTAPVAGAPLFTTTPTAVRTRPPKLCATLLRYRAAFGQSAPTNFWPPASVPPRVQAEMQQAGPEVPLPLALPLRPASPDTQPHALAGSQKVLLWSSSVVCS